MIERLLQHPHLLHQSADAESDLPEQPIAGSLDANGLICLSQEGRDIIVNRASVKELCKLLVGLRAMRREDLAEKLQRQMEAGK